MMNQNTEKNSRNKKVFEKIKKELRRVRNYTPKVGVFGDTGVGKSSLCNALFGKDVAKISDVEACTREPQEILVRNSEGNGIILLDVPGVGEDPVRDEEYTKLYQSLAPNLDLIIWAIKADDRKYTSSINIYKNILKQNIKKCPVIFVITQVEKIEPFRNWDEKDNRPGPEQENNIEAKINDISSRFEVSPNHIIAISAHDSYNLAELVNKVVEALPNEKKYSFAREAKEEVVSEKATEDAEKGVWDHIKEKSGDAWDYIKDDVVEFVVKDVLPKLGKVILSFWRKW